MQTPVFGQRQTSIFNMKLRTSRLQQLRRAIISSRSPCRVPPISISRTTPPRTYATVSAAELQFGQPVHETHPHLLRAGESMYTGQA